MDRIKSWLTNESGFEVFEGTTLMLGGVAIAVFVGTVVIAISTFEYIKFGNSAIGNGGEVDATLQQFH